MLYDGPSGNDINTLVSLYFIFHHCEASFLFCFCWRQVTNSSALAPHILLGNLCLWPFENQAKDVPVCQCFFLPPQWCCLGQEINLVGKWQEGRLLSSCLYWMSTAKMGTVRQLGQALWESELTQVRLLWSRVTPGCWLPADNPFRLDNLHLPGVTFTTIFLI